MLATWRVLLYTQKSYNHVMERLGIRLEVSLKNYIIIDIMLTDFLLSDKRFDLFISNFKIYINE